MESCPPDHRRRPAPIRPGRPADVDHLTQNVGAICLEHHALFDFVIDRVECSGGMRLPGQLRRCILRTYTWVSSFSRSTALSSLKLIVVAQLALAIESRSS